MIAKPEESFLRLSFCHLETHASSALIATRLFSLISLLRLEHKVEPVKPIAQYLRHHSKAPKDYCLFCLMKTI